MPEATVAAIVETRGGGAPKILLTRRNVKPFKGQWCLPGGHIDRYEPVRSAVIREVKEETGLDFDAAFLGCFDEIIPEHEIHAVVMVFHGDGIGTLNMQQDEVMEAEWVSIDEVRSLPLAFTHNDILDAYAAQADHGS
jgi:8-oxo-dGTP diphosphatase